MKDLNQVTRYLQGLKPRNKEVDFDEKLTQDHVTGNVFYPLSGGDGIALKVFPNARNYFYVDEHPFELTKGSEFTYFDESIFSKIYNQHKDCAELQSNGGYKNGYDISDIHYAYYRSEALDHNDIEVLDNDGISTILLGRLRVVYGAEISNIEKIHEKIYKIDFIHNNIEKSLYYISHLFNTNSAQFPEMIWLKERVDFDALLIKGFPFNGERRFYERKAITDLIIDDINKNPESFTIVSDNSMTALYDIPFNIENYKAAGFIALELNKDFGYSNQALVTNGKMLLERENIIFGTLFLLNIPRIISENHTTPQLLHER